MKDEDKTKEQLISELHELRQRLAEMDGDVADRKRAEEELRESVEKFRNLFNNSGVAMFRTRLDGSETLDTNEKFLEIVGRTRAETEGTPSVTFWEEPKERDAMVRRLVADGRVSELEFRMLNKQGGVRDCITSLVLYREEGILEGTIIDITARKKAEKALQESEAKLRAVLDTTPFPIAVVDLQDNIIHFWSRSALTLFGHTAPTASEWYQIAYPDPNYRREVIDRWKTFVEIARESRQTVNTGEYQVTCGDGSVRICELYATVLPDILIVTFNDITERKRAEEALRESESRYRELFEAESDAICLIDNGTGSILEANNAAVDLYGYDHAELLTKRNVDLSSEPEETRRVTQGTPIIPARVLTIPLRFHRKKDGTVFPVEITGRFFIMQGRAVHLVAIRDITERKQAEEVIRQANLVVENSPVVVFRWRAAQGWSVDMVSQNVIQFGYTPGELLSGEVPFASMVHPEDLDRVAREVQEYSASGTERFQQEYRIVTKDGGVRWVDDRTVVERNVDGQIGLYQGIVIDITERKRAEEALRASEEKYRHVVENAHDAIFIAQDGFIKFSNPQLAIVSGYSQEELSQQPFLGFVYPDDRELVARMHQQRMQGEEVPSTYSFRAVNKSGNTLWVELSRVFLSWEGRPASLNFLRDITVEKRLESQLVHAQKMEAVGTLAGGIAHDFNNLLQVVQGYAELLLMRKGEGEPGYRELQEISRAAKRGGELTRQLLTFSRKVESKLQLADLNRIVEDLRLLLERTIPKMIKIELHLTGNLHHVNADASQVEQILMNLAVNARDAMPDGGTLRIETKNVFLGEEDRRGQPELTPGEYVLLAVADTGQGIDKSTLESIFDPFFTTKEVGKGTGLGLAMVYGIVKSHHGHITCVSKPGEGTAFEIYLPAVEHPERATTIVTGTELSRGGHETVLLVDDDDSLRKLGEQILEAYGYTVLSAPDGESALQVYQECRDRIDLVVLDLMMPGMGGALCLQKVLEINPAAKIIIASGYSFNGETEKATESGAKAFIQKPYNVKQMLEVVRGVLDE